MNLYSHSWETLATAEELVSPDSLEALVFFERKFRTNEKVGYCQTANKKETAHCCITAIVATTVRHL